MVGKALRSSAEAPEYQRVRQLRPQLRPYFRLLDQSLEADAQIPQVARIIEIAAAGIGSATEDPENAQQQLH